MMNQNEFLALQKRVRAFILNGGNSMDFDVDCPLNERIKFIYKVIFPRGKRYLFYIRFFVSRIAFFIDYSPIKVLIYRCIGVRVGKGVFISSRVDIDVHFPSLIQIDDYAILGYGATIFCHDFINSRYRLGRVIIGEGAVIGGFSIVGCGVSVGKMANTTFRSVITKDIPDFFNQFERNRHDHE